MSTVFRALIEILHVSKTNVPTNFVILRVNNNIPTDGINFFTVFLKKTQNNWLLTDDWWSQNYDFLFVSHPKSATTKINIFTFSDFSDNKMNTQIRWFESGNSVWHLILINIWYIHNAHIKHTHFGMVCTHFGQTSFAHYHRPICLFQYEHG